MEYLKSQCDVVFMVFFIFILCPQISFDRVVTQFYLQGNNFQRGLCLALSANYRELFLLSQEHRDSEIQQLLCVT